MDQQIYKDVRPSIKSGDLLAWEGRSFFSWAIRVWTRSPVTHVGIAWVHKGRVYVLEAREGAGVCLTAVSQVSDFTLIPTDIQWSDPVERYALSLLGIPYGWGDILSIILDQKLHARGYICSEYVLDVYANAGLHIPHTSPTPGQVVDGLRQLKNPVITRVKVPHSRIRSV